MTDKARSLFPVSVTFSKGEQPTHTKLNGFATQTKGGLALIEKMIGDPWNQGGDPSLSPSGASVNANANYIPNLARAIGSMKHIGPRIQVDAGCSYTYIDNLGAHYTGKNEGYLHFKPFLNTAVTSGGTGGLDATPVSSPALVIAAGDWHVDTDGKFYSFSPISAAAVLTYEVQDTGLFSDLSNDTTPNLIPHPDDFTTEIGLSVKYANGTNATAGYKVLLPPRFAITGANRLLPGHPDVASNEGNDLATTSYWHTLSGTAGTTAIRRYRLPTFIRTLDPNTDIPDGYMYIWDNDRGTIIEGLSFKTTSGATSEYEFIVTTTPVSVFESVFSGLLGVATDLVTDYTTGHRFRLIVSSVSLAEHLGFLTERFLEHTHAKTTDGSALISHNDLLDLNTTTTAGLWYSPSNWAGDGHPQYLHRSGYSTARDQYCNAMNGDLLIASSTPTSNYINLAASSWALRFGSTDGPTFWYYAAHKGAWGSGDGAEFIPAVTANEGVLKLGNRDLCLLRSAAGNSTRIWWSSSGDSNQGGLLRYKPGDALNNVFSFGSTQGSSEPAPSSANVVMGRLLVGDFPKASTLTAFGVATARTDLTTTGTALECYSNAANNFVISLRQGATALNPLLQFNGDNTTLAVNVEFAGKSDTVSDPSTGSHVYLKNKRLFFGPKSSANYNDIVSGPSLYHNGVDTWYLFGSSEAGPSLPADSQLGLGTLWADHVYGLNANLGLGAVIFEGEVYSDFIPSASARDLGSTTKRWDLFARAIDATVTVTALNFNLTSPAREGYVSINPNSVHMLTSGAGAITCEWQTNIIGEIDSLLSPSTGWFWLTLPNGVLLTKVEFICEFAGANSMTATLYSRDIANGAAAISLGTQTQAGVGGIPYTISFVPNAALPTTTVDNSSNIYYLELTTNAMTRVDPIVITYTYTVLAR